MVDVELNSYHLERPHPHPGTNTNVAGIIVNHDCIGLGFFAVKSLTKNFLWKRLFHHLIIIRAVLLPLRAITDFLLRETFRSIYPPRSHTMFNLLTFSVMPSCNRRIRNSVIIIMMTYTFLIGCCSSFNIDTVHPMVYKDPSDINRPNVRESYFGYSVQFLFNQVDSSKNSAKWLLVGAPRANSTLSTLSNLKEPGQVYRCRLTSIVNSNRDTCQPLLIEREASGTRNSIYRDRKDYGWLGGSMDVHSPFSGRIAICGYRWANQRLLDKHFMNGVCYWNRHQIKENENFNKVLPIVTQALDLQTFENGTFNYAYGQAGFSVHMVLRNGKTEEMIIGAPGVYKWTGAVIRITDDLPSVPDGIPSRKKREETDEGVVEFGQFSIPDVPNINQLEPNDYFGYSVHSGIFFDDGKLLYVGGAPRSFGMKGKVLIFDFLPGKGALLDIKVELKGAQLGEYFGSSVLAVDLTQDGLSELLVGAPQHSVETGSHDRTGDEGKVYLYTNLNGQLLAKTGLYGSKAPGARFGTAMAAIGDINRDGFNDVAIGAPYENDKGAVYIYLGGRTDIQRHPVRTYWQRIAAADFVKPLDGLKGFGISIVAADMDGNEYPDLAVGSYQSGHVLVLRSQPVIQLKLLMSTGSKGMIDPNGGSLQLKVCSSFERPVRASAHSIPEICVGYSFYFDVDYLNIPRLSLEMENGTVLNRQPFNFTRIVTVSPSCQVFKLAVTNLPYYNQDFSRSAKLQLHTKLLSNIRPIQNQCLPREAMKETPGSKQVLIFGGKTNGGTDSFCPGCPVLDATDKDFVESSVSFTSECGEDNFCKEDLEVGIILLSNVEDLIVGSKNPASFQVSVINYGEPSYVTTLEIRLPSYVHLKRAPANLCQRMNEGSEEQGYSCHLRVNPLKRGKAEKMEFQLDLESVTSGAGNILLIDVEARMKGSRAMGRLASNNLTIALKTSIDVEIIGKAVEEQLTYVRPNRTANVTLEERIAFQHLYEVRNLLPSPANKVDIGITFPFSVSTAHRGRSLSLTEQVLVQAAQKGVQSKTECHLRLKDIGQMTFVNSNLLVKTQPELKYAQANRTAIFDCFNSPGVTCVEFVCSIGPLTSQTPVTVTLSGMIRLEDILGFIGQKDVFILSSVGQVMLVEPSNIQQPPDHRPDVATAVTHVLPQGPPVAKAVASWIIALSVLAGILLLTLLVVALHKIGFFQRQRIPEEALVQENTAPNDENSDGSNANQQTD